MGDGIWQQQTLKERDVGSDTPIDVPLLLPLSEGGCLEAAGPATKSSTELMSTELYGLSFHA